MQERRRAAVEELVRILRVGGQALIYVWALEQEKDSVKSNYLSESRIQKKQTITMPVDEVSGGNDPDSVSNVRTSMDNPSEHPGGSNVLGQDSGECGKGITTPESSLPVHVNRTHFDAQDMLVPWHLREKQQKGQKQCKDSSASTGSDIADETSGVFHRYYHVFKKGELEELCMTLSDIDIIRSYYDKGNWCVILKKKS